MNFSFWEVDSWFSNIDYTVVGSGITGLNAALRIKQQDPDSKILILEKGMLPEGASTKNAGFACFGSISEIIDDLSSHSPEEVVELVRKRKEGLELLRSNLGDKAIDYKTYGGYELFSPNDEGLYSKCILKLPQINELLRPVFHEDVFSEIGNNFRFEKIQEKLIFNKFEGQIDTGKMMHALLRKVHSTGIRILNHVEVIDWKTEGSHIQLHTRNLRIKTNKLIVATNGFASKFGIDEVKPARAQILITKPIKNLPFKGTFHLEKGFYYFRNIGDRVLFGGGRNLDFKTEETDIAGTTEIIQQQLKVLLQECILPNTEFEIDYSWSGIMGVGNQKKPIIKELSKNIFCAVRLGGMGVAIGSMVGREVADLALES